MYEAVTADEYEFPICYGESSRDIAHKLGVNSSSVLRAVERGNISRNPYNNERYRIVKVEVNDE